MSANDGTADARGAASGARGRKLRGLSRSANREVPMSPWVDKASKRQESSKLGLAEHIAYHLIEYGMVIYMGPGTTNNLVADRIFQRQIDDQDPLDLTILTNNLTIHWIGADHAKQHPELFGTTQIISTGGTYHSSINSAVGRFAAKAIESDILFPHVILFGAAGVSFAGEGTLSYHFGEELDSQLAYATRPTSHRVLVCDHSKLGRPEQWKGASMLDLLRNTPRCTIITSAPTDTTGQRDLEQAIGDFTTLVKNRPEDSCLARLRVVDSKGVVVDEAPR